MSLYTNINYLFHSKETEDMLHSERMEKLRELIDKSNKESYNFGFEQGIIKCKQILGKALDEVKRENKD